VMFYTKHLGQLQTHGPRGSTEAVVQLLISEHMICYVDQLWKSECKRAKQAEKKGVHGS
jgi:hypothetical protein